MSTPFLILGQYVTSRIIFLSGNFIYEVDLFPLLTEILNLP